MDDDHPLRAELASLRQSAARFQHEAHAAAIRLQRHTLDSARLHDHAAALERENAQLAHELAVLRAHPDVQQHPAATQVQELSLALRRVSDKIALTEDALLARTSDLTDTRSEILRARHTADAAYELAAHSRAREEAAKAREREFELKARASEEERKMSDRVVQEYAALVRNLEGRMSANHAPNESATLADALQNDKSTLHGMLATFSAESDQLHTTITELRAQVSELQMTLEVEHSAASYDRTLLSQTRTELDKLNIEDQTAAKMVTRYMKFSQASTNALQQQITTLKTRHASTIATLELQLSTIESQLASECARTARLQDALDELCEDLARESYGRRREVALRLALLSREEGVAEFMRRWARRARELYARCYTTTQPEDSVQESFHRVVNDAESLLSTLDSDVQISETIQTSGSLARIALSGEAVDALRNELQDEVQKRLEAVQKYAFSLPDGHSEGTPSGIENHLQSDRTPSQAPDPLLLTPNGNAPSAESLPLQSTDSPVSVVSAPIGDDPFVLSAPSNVEPISQKEMPLIPAIQGGVSTSVTLVDEEKAAVQSHSPGIHPMSSPSIQESASTSVTLLVEEETQAAVQLSSPAVSTQDLQQDLKPSPKETSPTTAVASMQTLPKATRSPPPDVEARTQPTATAADAPPSASTPPAPDPSTASLFSELDATQHRYDALERALRDCSLALKDLTRTLNTSPAPPGGGAAPTTRAAHLATALARLEDYCEDARVELAIRVADEALTARGYATVLAVPGALAAGERAEIEAGVRAFVDGHDEGVVRAVERFERKLEELAHDVAVVKRAVHGLAMSDGEVEEDDEASAEATGEREAGSGWTAWTVGLLGASTAPRSPTPAQTFGAVMTSPRVRRASSVKASASQESLHEARGPLAGLNLRVPMPMGWSAGSGLSSPSATSLQTYGPLGLGRAVEGRAVRTISAMYAVGGFRSASSVGLGVGLGSSSPARRPGVQDGLVGSPLGGAAWSGEDTQKSEARQDLGGVE